DELQRQALLGGYRLLEPTVDPGPRVILAAAGPILPEVLEAANELADEGVAPTVLNITSADRLYADWLASRLAGVRAATLPDGGTHIEAPLIRPEERPAPIVTVLDGASHALAFLGAVFGQRTVPLGMDRFGQSGARGDLYNYAGIDAGHIVNAALIALGTD